MQGNRKGIKDKQDRNAIQARSKTARKQDQGQGQDPRKGRKLALVLITLFVLGLCIATATLFVGKQQRQQGNAFPVGYRALIEQYATEQGLEPAYVAAVILAESSYNPLARSNANAQGLMQILPSTGEWIAGKFDERYVEGCLFDAETNIRYGCWYLGFLMRRYDGDKACSSAAYHSGQGTVDGWLKKSEYSKDGRTLDVIPGANAETYVKRVLGYYEEYVEIYAQA